MKHDLPYFFGCKTQFYSFLNSPKNLDPSYKMDLDLWDCLGKVKLVFYQNFIGLIESFVVILERGNKYSKCVKDSHLIPICCHLY